MTWTIYIVVAIFLAGITNAQDDSFAGSFLSEDNVRTENLNVTTTSPKPIKFTTTQKVNKPTKSESTKKDGVCPGVCVANHIAEYCEAYLITNGICRLGSKCCVPRDNYGDKLPADLRIPNSHNNQTVGSQSTTQKPTKSSNQDVESENLNVTTTSPKPTSAPKCPGYCILKILSEFCEKPAEIIPNTWNCKEDSVCCDNTRLKTTTIKPLSMKFGSKWKPTKQNVSSAKNPTSEPKKPQELQRESIEGNHTNSKQCNGECVSGLFALFCDELDSEAYCPNKFKCCVRANNLNVTTTSPKPTSAPKCPGYCLVNLFRAFCEKPAEIILTTSNCKEGTVCCDNTRSGTTPRPRPIRTTTTVKPYSMKFKFNFL